MGKLIVRCEACDTRFRAPTKSIGTTKVCPKCGHALAIEPAAPGVIDRHCARCGMTMPWPETRCTSCGKRHVEAREELRAERERGRVEESLETKYPWFTGSVAGAGLLFILGCVGTGFLLANGGISRKLMIAPLVAVAASASMVTRQGGRQAIPRRRLAAVERARARRRELAVYFGLAAFALVLTGGTFVWVDGTRSTRQARRAAEREEAKWSRLMVGEREHQRLAGRVSREARVTAARDIERLHAAVEAYVQRHGEVPPMLFTLTRSDPDNDDEPYLVRLPRDPWGRAYQLVTDEGGGFAVLYLGEDGREGGEGHDADLRSDSAVGGSDPERSILPSDDRR